jgi:hypothetical protein
MLMELKIIWKVGSEDGRWKEMAPSRASAGYQCVEPCGFTGKETDTHFTLTSQTLQSATYRTAEERH